MWDTYSSSYVIRVGDIVMVIPITGGGVLRFIERGDVVHEEAGASVPLVTVGVGS